jgi:hypothetical protein
MNETNPIEASRDWLVECGYTAEEAANLIRALKHRSKERLWELAPRWIEHLGQHRKYTTLLECVATGIVEVTQDSEDEGWLFALSKEYRDSPQGRKFAAEHGFAT